MENFVESIVDSTGTLIGTCFAIFSDDSFTWYLTAGHNLKCECPIFIAGHSVTVDENLYENGVDIALLYTSKAGSDSCNIAVIAKPELVTVVGYELIKGNPKRERFQSIKCKPVTIENNVADEKLNYLKLVSEKAFSSGSSGSPVFCDTTGHVVGLLLLKHGENTNYSICAKHFDKLENYKSLDVTVSNIPVGDVVCSLDQGERMLIEKQLEIDHEQALRSFVGVPPIWVEPTLHSIAESEARQGEAEDGVIDLRQFLKNPNRSIIYAHQHYGLTSLGRRLALKSWREFGQFWLYLDVSQLKPYVNQLEKLVKESLKNYALNIDDVGCVVIDNWDANATNARKQFELIVDQYSDLPIIFLVPETAIGAVSNVLNDCSLHEVSHYYLWALDRSGIRDLVSKYNSHNFISDESELVASVTSDLDSLNIPRTPFNCVTILKSYEAGFDDKAVNRTEIIRRVLHLLFNTDKIPQYKTKPDLIDVHHILGFYCMQLFRSDKTTFARSEFLNDLRKYCVDSEISVEIEIIFDVLLENNIIVEQDATYRFRFLYWMLYFSAHRMHRDEHFMELVQRDYSYARHPELMEFYSGINREADSVIEVLCRDLDCLTQNIKMKFGFPDVVRIYDDAVWEPSDKGLQEMIDELKDDVNNSNLPVNIKDAYADKNYDRTRPLSQEINTLFEEYDFRNLLFVIRASSNTLRNCDYSDVKLRHKLLGRITAGLDVVSDVLICFSPILAKDLGLRVDGVNVLLCGFEGTSESERFRYILYGVPDNIILNHSSSLISKRLGPLMNSHIASESDPYIKHLLVLMVAAERPVDWQKCVESYIQSTNKNSFYLFSLNKLCKGEYIYGFLDSKDEKRMKNILKMIAIKHVHGTKNPSKKQLRKISDENFPARKNQ